MRLLGVAAFAVILFASESIGTEVAEEELRAWAHQHLVNSVADRFVYLASQKNVNYVDLADEKAGAACVRWSSNPHTPVWGGGWEYETADGAREAAIRQCEQARETLGYAQDCECVLLFSGDTKVLVPPDQVIDETVEWVEGLKVPTMCSSWIGDDSRPVSIFKGSCPDYERRSPDRIKFVINRVLPAASSADAPDIYPGGPIARRSDIEKLDLRNPADGRPIWSFISFYPEVGDSYIDTWSTPLTLPEHWVYEFRLHRVPRKSEGPIRLALIELDRTKMYGRLGHRLEKDIDLPFYSPDDEFARYTRRYDLTDEETRKAFPGRLIETTYAGKLLGETSTAIWIESYVLVDANWIPVRAPERNVVPVALETNSGLYLYSIEIVPQKAYAGTVDHFEGRVFDLSSCQEIVECFRDASEALRLELDSVFQSKPIAAAPIRDHRPPGQLRYQRLFEESEVLRGLAGPYYELSTYTVTYWTGPSDSFAGTGESYFTRKSSDSHFVEPANQMYLHIDHSLQISVGRKGTYEEPEVDEYARYRGAVRKAVKSAIEKASERVGAKVTPEGVGVVVDREDRK